MYLKSVLASSAALLLGLASLAAGDSLTISHNCSFTKCGTWATFHTSFGSFEVDGHDGCYYEPTGVPYMRELCIDEGNQRAHFIFNEQGKRCLTLETHEDGGCDGWTTCFTNYYTEAPCTWGLLEAEVQGAVGGNGTAVKPRGRYAKDQ